MSKLIILLLTAILIVLIVIASIEYSNFQYQQELSPIVYDEECERIALEIIAYIESREINDKESAKEFEEYLDQIEKENEGKSCDKDYFSPRTKMKIEQYVEQIRDLT